MKNAALLFGLWLGIVLFAYSVVFLTGDRMPAMAVAGDVETVSASHGFSLALPPAWTYRAGDPADRVIAPVADVEVWALDVEASTPDGALAAAWEAIDPCSSCQRPAVAASAPLADGREGVALTLGPDEEGRTGSALVVYVDDAARVLLVRQSPQAVLPARVESDLARMEASFHGLPSQDAGA